MSYSHNILARLAVLLVLLLSASAVLATDSPVAKNTSAVSIELTVVQASKDGKVDPKLAALSNQLTRSFGAYRGFALVEKHDFVVQHAESVVKRLKNNKVVIFGNMGKDVQKLRIRLDIDGANVMMNVQEGELWFHARREQRDRALILAVRARTVAQ